MVRGTGSKEQRETRSTFSEGSASGVVDGVLDPPRCASIVLNRRSYLPWPFDRRCRSISGRHTPVRTSQALSVRLEMEGRCDHVLASRMHRGRLRAASIPSASGFERLLGTVGEYQSMKPWLPWPATSRSASPMPVATMRSSKSPASKPDRVIDAEYGLLSRHAGVWGRGPTSWK